MKPNVNNRKQMAQRTLLLSGVIVAVIAAFAAGAYSGSVRDLQSRQQDSLVLDRLVQVSRFNVLIKDLNRRKVADARQFLSLTLAGDMKQAETLAMTANIGAVEQVKCTLAQIGRDEKAHPDYYAVQHPVLQSPRSMEVARQDAK